MLWIQLYTVLKKRGGKTSAMAKQYARVTCPSRARELHKASTSSKKMIVGRLSCALLTKQEPTTAWNISTGKWSSLAETARSFSTKPDIAKTAPKIIVVLNQNGLDWMCVARTKRAIRKCNCKCIDSVNWSKKGYKPQKRRRYMPQKKEETSRFCGHCIVEEQTYNVLNAKLLR